MKSVTMPELQKGDRVQTGIRPVTRSELQIGDQVQTGMKPITMSELHIGDRVQTGMKSVTMVELKKGDRVQTGMKMVKDKLQCYLLSTEKLGKHESQVLLTRYKTYLIGPKINGLHGTQ